ncbi:polysaccharide pyruvyl transferase family protein [Scatolibacter rhodanostii]|uniref:polysaccharide pyruvyl transferase family protein n=1 Tax=Scatolibacter rhodanostii TaxID=2014781 RepID=UPI000C0781A8|nr:polysaccharide pyruvyl transferase family protein [Scatolibacter rhodanostii]
MKIKAFILKHKRLFKLLLPLRNIYHQTALFVQYKRILKKTSAQKKYIFYIGIPVHNNLGDLAQGVCIRKWIRESYPNREVIELETDCLVNTKLPLINQLKQCYQKDDIIIFQSGYTTTDLGGFADEMHRAVITALPNAKILMMPQTIFFQDQQKQNETSFVYNRAKNMLFLARDRISFELAIKMFPDIRVKLFPDIVTSMIGTRVPSLQREGILFCCRDDTEKYYSEEELNGLIEKCRKQVLVHITDTTKKGNAKDIVRDAKKYIEKEIDSYGKYKLIITDRYHGTIFSLIAGTPVILIKTTDHKVITGGEWFKGVYDTHVFIANDLDEAYDLATKIIDTNINYTLVPYFKEKYYDKLRKILEEEN